MNITESNRKDKRFKAVFDNGKVIHFGQRNPVNGTYIDHHNKRLRAAYIARHSGEDWGNPYTAGTLSRFILWGDSTDINENKKNFIKKFL